LYQIDKKIEMDNRQFLILRHLESVLSGSYVKDYCFKLDQFYQKTRISYKTNSPGYIYEEKCWHFDPKTERSFQFLNDSQSPYLLLEATYKDYKKVEYFYNLHPVPNYEISSVKVIYNRTFNQKFECQIETLQRKARAGNSFFSPKWRFMSDVKLREENYENF